DDVVCIVGDSRGHRPALETETTHEADADAPGGVMPFDRHAFEQVGGRVGDCLSVTDGRVDLDEPGDDLAGDQLDTRCGLIGVNGELRPEDGRDVDGV